MKVSTKIKFVKLTSNNNNQPIYLNIDMIGDIIESDGCTRVGHLTHNNGGFKVREKVEKVLELINQLNN
jgi:hypothetical protein